MSRRAVYVLAFLGIVVAAGVAFVAYEFFLRVPEPFALTLKNDSSSALAGLTLVSSAGPRTSIPDVAPAASVSVRPNVGPSEQHLTLVDADGREYLVLGYFEGDPGGTVVISVSGVTPDGLVGQVDDRTYYSPSGQFPLRVEPQ